MLRFFGTIGGVGRKLMKIKLGNSQTFEIGDLVKTYSNGVADLAAVATPALGVITGFVDANGTPLPDSAVVAGTASGVTQRSVTTDATNSTNYYALVDVSKDTIYSASVSGTLGTTASSNLMGCWIGLNSAGGDYGQLLESTASRTAHSATAAMNNFYSLGLDPNDSTRLLVILANSEMATQIDVTP